MANYQTKLVFRDRNWFFVRSSSYPKSKVTQCMCPSVCLSTCFCRCQSYTHDSQVNEFLVYGIILRVVEKETVSSCVSAYEQRLHCLWLLCRMLLTQASWMRVQSTWWGCHGVEWLTCAQWATLHVGRSATPHHQARSMANYLQGCEFGNFAGNFCRKISGNLF